MFVFVLSYQELRCFERAEVRDTQPNLECWSPRWFEPHRRGHPPPSPVPDERHHEMEALHFQQLYALCHCKTPEPALPLQSRAFPKSGNT